MQVCFLDRSNRRLSIPRGNNAWPVRMPLRMSRISRPPLVGRKPVRKPKKIKIIKFYAIIYKNNLIE